MDLTEIYQLDEVDQKILGYIAERLTYQEMADELNRPARSGIFRRVTKLLLLGLVTKDPKKSRSRRLTEDGRRVLDQITSP